MPHCAPAARRAGCSAPPPACCRRAWTAAASSPGRCCRTCGQCTAARSSAGRRPAAPAMLHPAMVHRRPRASLTALSALTAASKRPRPARQSPLGPSCCARPRLSSDPCACSPRLDLCWPRCPESTQLALPWDASARLCPSPVSLPPGTAAATVRHRLQLAAHPCWPAAPATGARQLLRKQKRYSRKLGGTRGSKWIAGARGRARRPRMGGDKAGGEASAVDK